MLTLQNILDSDSISTLVAKLNANFQTISLSNGGPQGVRGEQGIPGLPGKQGATGPSGPIGATGPSTQIIPFSTTGSLVTPSGSVLFPPPAYNDRSYEFLTTGPNAWGPWGTGPTSLPVVHGQLYFDNNQLGWWKYLDIPDPTPLAEGGSATAIDGQPSEYYVESPYYLDVDGGSWTGPDWYWYPLNTSAIIAAAAGVWVSDRTNYLGLIASSAYNSPPGPPDPLTQAPFDIPNARMSSKFGTVWITSYDEDGGSTSDNETGLIYDWDYLNSPRLNSGIDRSLFKMSIDGPRYFDNMKARGFRTTDSGDIIYAPYTVGGNPVPLSGPSPLSPGANQNLFVQPLYNVSIDAYSPIVFFTNRGYTGTAVDSSTTLGYYQLSPADGTAGSIKIHNFTTRDGIDDFFNLGGNLTGSTNTGEMLFDVRRFMTSNQFMNMMPQDTESFTSLENDPTVAAYAPFDLRTGTTIMEWNTDYAWKVYQGYHSMFTGQMMIDGAISGNQQTYTGYDNWVYNNRQSWYGTSIYAELPDASDADVTSTQELVRSAGVMVRGKAGAGVIPASVSTDGVLIYTSNMPTGPTNYDTAADNNILQSLPIAYFSPLRNTGIGTVTMDRVGVFEPSARLHVHADWRPENEAQETITNYVEALESGPYTDEDKSWLSYTTWLPRRRMKAAAFTIERAQPGLIYDSNATGPYSDNPLYQTAPNTFSDWYNGGVFNDVLFGAVNPPASEPQVIGITTSVKSAAAIRYEALVYRSDSRTPTFANGYLENFGGRFGTPVDHYNPSRNGGWLHKGALRLGASPVGGGSVSGAANPPQEIGVDANYQSIEFSLSISPLSVDQTTDKYVGYAALSGIGMHTLYPRTRSHFFGKNGYKAFMFDEAATPGTVDGLNALPAVGEDYPLPSNFQISIDYIGEAYKYNAAIFDYAYDYGVTLSSPAVAYTPWSANVKNYPTREAASASGPTLATFNPTTNGSNLALAINTPGTTSNAIAAVHGGAYNAYFNPNKYIGFNLYRDLLGKGDSAGQDAGLDNIGVDGVANDQYASVWRTGAQGLPDSTGDVNIDGLYNRPYDANGGAAILADDEGRLGFAFIAAGRDGGSDYARWEQQGIGQREIVNSIKILFDSDGNIGIGNAPGLDENAYPALYRDPTTGYINYLGNAYPAVSGENPTATGPLSYSSNPSGVWVPGTTDYYGYANASYGPTYATPRQIAQINSQATLSENIRLEVAAEKAQSRIGHHIESRGYGYPGFFLSTGGTPSGTGGVITITDDANATWAKRYFGIDGTPTEALWSLAVHTFTFDNLGRIMSYTANFLGGWTDGDDILQYCPKVTLPHPTEFSSTGLYQPSYNTLTNGYPYFWANGTFSYTREVNGSVLDPFAEIWIPTSASAAILGSLIYNAGTTIATATFRREPLSSAVVRLNNFVLGDGYEFIRSNGDSTDITTVVDASSAATQEIYTARTASPKLLLTFGAPDYMTMESAASGLTSGEITNLINAGLAPLMKVTTVIDSAQTDASLRTYTIPKADNTGGTFLVVTDHMGNREQDQPGLANLYPTPSGGNPQRLRVDRVTAYEVQKVGLFSQATAGVYRFNQQNTADQFSYEMLPIQYVKLPGSPVYPHQWGIESGIYGINPLDPTQSVWAEVTRDLDLYWGIKSYNGDDISNFVNENGTQFNEDFINTNWSSGIRYRRLNENYVLFDFNITLEPRTVTFNNGAETLPLSGIIGTDGAGSNYEYYVHSPYAAGTYGQALQAFNPDGDGDQVVGGNWIGIDARWVQYIRFTYDISLDNDFDGLPNQIDPYFYERQFGGGANFGNWSEFRAWYPGTAVVGSDYLSDAGDPLPYSERNHWDNNNVIGTAYSTPNWDGSPYNRSGEGSNVIYNKDAIPLVSKTWTGRFTDWYWSTYQADPLLRPFSMAEWTQQIQDWNVAMAVTPNAFPDGVDPDSQDAGSAKVGLFGANPWQTAASAPGTYFPDTRIGLVYDQYFKKSLANVNGYKFLMKNWLQYVGTIDPAFDAHTVLVTVPQYFDAIVWRSFGEDAWNRNVNFQWRITPQYADEIGSTVSSGQQFNSIAIEIMFDKPIFLSGAKRNPISSSSGDWDQYVAGNNGAGGRPVPADSEYKWSDWDRDITLDVFDLTNGAYQTLIENKINAETRFWFNTNATTLDNGQEFVYPYAPFGSITLRGQNIVQYRKSYARSSF
jgi:hypothetical protein